MLILIIKGSPGLPPEHSNTVIDKLTNNPSQMATYRNRSGNRKIARVAVAMWCGAVLLASASTGPLAQPAAATEGSLDTLADVRQALRRCWRWPPQDVSGSGMELAVRLTFKRSGEISGVRISFQTPEASEEERQPYNSAVQDRSSAALRCRSPKSSARRSRAMS